MSVVLHCLCVCVLVWEQRASASDCSEMNEGRRRKWWERVKRALSASPQILQGFKTTCSEKSHWKIEAAKNEIENNTFRSAAAFETITTITITITINTISLHAVTAVTSSK